MTKTSCRLRITTKATLAVSLVLGAVHVAFPQNPAVVHNSWSTPTQMPVAVGRPGIAVLNNRIILLGGGTENGEVANTQIYNPATNEWNTGPQIPVATAGGCAAVVKNTLYFIGGWTGVEYSDAVWAYYPDQQTWNQKAAMPTAREGAFACVVANDIVYVMGGYNGEFLDNNEGYNPATNSWTEEAPMLSAESDLMGGGLIGDIVIVANGSDGAPDRHNQGYNSTTNTWEWLTSDPITRQGTCVASIGSLFYSAGGWYYSDPAFDYNESFSLSTGSWATLAPMPTSVADASGVAYDGQLYCFGGNNNEGTLFNIVQVYQP